MEALAPPPYYRIVSLAMFALIATCRANAAARRPFGFVTPAISAQRRLFHASSACRLNRFLFDQTEVTDEIRVVLPKDDYRTVHAAKILGLVSGDRVRAGVVSGDDRPGLLTDDAVVEWIPEGKVKKAEPLKNGKPPGSLSFRLEDLSPAAAGNATESSVGVSLLLALPRPLQLGRMLPMIAQLGVDRLILTNTKKVPKDYFGCHLLRTPEELRERLIEGLCQAGDVTLPTVRVVKNFEHFLRDDLDELFPVDKYARVLAHPQRKTDPPGSIKRMGQIDFPTSGKTPNVLVAVGPEGGWEEPDELDQLKDLGFQQVTLGSRTLRSDVAVMSLLSLAHEACYEERIRKSGTEGSE